MSRKLIIALSFAIAAAASGSANAISITLDNGALTVVRPLSGSTVVDFTGHVTLSTGYAAMGGGLSSLWTAGGYFGGGDVIDSTFPSFTYNLDGILFSVTVSALDGLGLYAFDAYGGPAYVNFSECQIGGGACGSSSVNYSLNVVEATVPEPASLALLALGLAGLGFSRRKKA